MRVGSHGRTWLILLSLVALVLTACTRSHDGNEFNYSSASAAGTVIPAADRKAAGLLSVQLLDGTEYTLAAQAGKVVVLNFWGTWCPPCVVETPQFDAVYRSRKSQGVSFLGVDVKDAKDAVRSFVHDKDITYPIAFDYKAKTMIQLGHVPATSLPVTVLIDKQGRVAAVYLHRVFPADLNPVLDKLLAER